MRPKYIIIHHSLTSDGTLVNWQAIRKYHKSWAYQGKIITHEKAIELINHGEYVKQPWRETGYQMGIELIGGRYEILLGRMLNETGAHCRERGMNGKSIGICIIGNYDDNEVPDEAWSLAIRLVKSLMKLFYIPVENVLGHKELAHYKTCPGAKFDMKKFRSEL